MLLNIVFLLLFFIANTAPQRLYSVQFFFYLFSHKIPEELVLACLVCFRRHEGHFFGLGEAAAKASFFVAVIKKNLSPQP